MSCCTLARRWQGGGGEEMRVEEKGFGAAVGLQPGVLINQLSGNTKGDFPSPMV